MKLTSPISMAYLPARPHLFALLAALGILLFICPSSSGQTPAKTRHLFVITIDGFRWQEIFAGADPVLMNDTRYVRDTALTRQLYDDSTPNLRRSRLMPFFWNTIAQKGQLFGNRNFHNKVNVKNFYKISYPGYNEILTGHTDAFISPNLAINNRNTSVLEYLNNSLSFQGKVAVFTSWNVFPYILNETRSHLPVNSGYQKLDEPGNLSADLIDSVQDIMPRSHTRQDLLTFLTAREYIGRHHPSVVFLGLGETDECAHAGRYDLYLQKASGADRIIAELWYAVQTDPFYRDSTTFLITTDHGRGSKSSTWSTHGFWAKGSGEIWLAMLGPDLKMEGEIKTSGQVYQKQFAATIALLMGDPSGEGHPPGKPISFLPANTVLPETGTAAIQTFPSGYTGTEAK
ncbi:hypothetical protein ACX0G9_29200 [Flavitalea flava]